MFPQSVVLASVIAVAFCGWIPSGYFDDHHDKVAHGADYNHAVIHINVNPEEYHNEYYGHDDQSRAEYLANEHEGDDDDHYYGEHLVESDANHHSDDNHSDEEHNKHNAEEKHDDKEKHDDDHTEQQQDDHTEEQSEDDHTEKEQEDESTEEHKHEHTEKHSNDHHQGHNIHHHPEPQYYSHDVHAHYVHQPVVAIVGHHVYH